MSPEEKKEYNKRYYQEHKEFFAKHNRDYYEDHKEDVKKLVNASYQRNKEKRQKQIKEYAEKNEGQLKEKRREWEQTKNGKASCRLHTYKIMDKNNFGGGTTITKRWIIDNIFSGQKCYYCGESDWKKLGCDRIDNSKPHTPDNVVCACGACNLDRRNRNKSVDDYFTYRQSI